MNVLAIDYLRRDTERKVRFYLADPIATNERTINKVSDDKTCLSLYVYVSVSTFFSAATVTTNKY